jgi:hypothetical protein
MNALTRSAIAALFFAAGAAPTFAQAPDPLDSVINSLKALRSQYGSVTGSSQAWTVTLTTNGLTATGIVNVVIGAGKYRYSASGSALNALASTQYEVAYDGTRYQLLDKTASVLSYRAADAQASPFGVPNPYMLVWDFLSIDDDQCDSCSLRPGDLWDANIWEARLDKIQLVSYNAGTQTTVVSLPGGKIDGVDFTFLVTLVGPANSQLPTTIERVKLNSPAITKVTLSNYSFFQGVGGALVLPTAIAVVGECEETVAVDYVLSVMSLPGPSGLGSSPFTIDFASANSVWDSDLNVFIKSP